MKDNERSLSLAAIAIGLIGAILQFFYLFSVSLGSFTNLFFILVGGPVYLLYTILQGFRVDWPIIILAFLYVLSSAYSLYLVITSGRHNWWLAFAFLTPFFPAIILAFQKLQKTGFLQAGKKTSTTIQPVTPVSRPVIDLRSSAEIQMQRDAQTPASDDDESLAHQLLQLDRRADAEYESNKDAFNHTQAEVHRIGELLNQRGGEDKMKKVLYRVQALSGHTRWIEGVWNGIGTWMG